MINNCFKKENFDYIFRYIVDTYTQKEINYISRKVIQIATRSKYLNCDFSFYDYN